MSELMRNAQKVSENQGRLRSLLSASQAVVEQLDLPTVLRRIVEVAVELVGARYGALGVLAADGHLEQFIHVGVSDELAARMGDLPRGRGILGALVEDPRPIRLRQLGEDPRSVGFPPHHPPMDSFVGVPVRVRDEVFGNLYLTQAPAGEFTEEDVEVLSALAATAGSAIDNARLFEETRRRQRWSAALAEVTGALLLAESEGDALHLIAERVATLASADLVAMVRDVGTDVMVVDTARGPRAAGVDGLVFPAADTLTARALTGAQPLLVPASSPGAEAPLLGGPAMVIPMISAGAPIAALTVSRAPGAREFTAQDLEMAADFAGQASVALELAAARSDRQRLVVLEDRSRIASDLHDHVIQRLFAAGLGMQALTGRVDPDAEPKLAEQIRALDEAIVAIRTAVFALTSRQERHSPVRHRVIGLIAELGDLFPAVPRLTFAGPVDLAIPDELTDDLLAVLREGLTNVARHAHATETSVSLAVRENRVTLEITDDGVGIGNSSRRGGLANLARRAQQWGGSFSHRNRDEGGTVLTWAAGTTAAEPDAGATAVFLVDDHEIVRRGVADLIDAQPDLKVIGEAGTARQALRRIPATTPDVVVLDVRLPDGSGIDVCREVRSAHPELRCLIFTAFDDDEAHYAAVLAGASGYVLKDIGGQNLVESIRRVARGESLLDRSMTRRVVERLEEPSSSGIEPGLTPRERQVLELVADGLTNRQIAEQLDLAEKTVKNHVSALLAKLGMERRTQAAVYAARLRDG